MGNRKLIGLGLILLSLIGALALLFFQGQPSDEALIKEALRDSIQAGKEGRPGSVLDLLTRDFELDNQQIVSDREVARFIRDSKPDVDIENWEPIVDGDRAQLETAISIKVGLPLNQTITLPNVRLTFRKERAARWLIFPGAKWRLSRADTRGSLPSQDMLQ